MQPYRLLVACLCLLGTISSSGATVSQAVVSIINAECKKCDDQFSASISDYQQNYGKWKSSVEAARYFCGKFELVNQCYVDCVGGRSLTYFSNKKRQFDAFYAESCDPVCYSTVMPWCYMKHVGQYRLDQSCDSSTNALKSNLRLCLVEELFYKQNCNGSCTPGQRRANFIFMQLMSSCLVPLSNQDDCFNWVQYCIGNYYGSSGNDFALQTDDNLRQNNSLSCDFYHTKFVSCMQRSVNSRVTLGEEPSLTTYDKPCHNYQDQIDYLEDLTQDRLTKAVCQNPDFSLSDICDAAGSAVEPTTRSPAAFSASASLIVSSANQPQPTSVVAASPTQASLGGGGGTMVSNPLETTQSLASRPSTDPVSSNASPSTAAITSQSASDANPVNASPSTAAPANQPASDADPAIALPTAADGGGATHDDSLPKGSSLAATPPVASTSVSTSGITVPASSSVPSTTRKNLVLGFFDLPPTTPAPTTTRRPRATLGSGGGAGAGGGNLLFEGPPTTPGDSPSTTSGDGELQDSTDDMFGGDGPIAVTGGRVTRPHKLLNGFEDSSAALAAAPLSLLAALLLQVLLWQRLAAVPL